MRGQCRTADWPVTRCGESERGRAREGNLVCFKVELVQRAKLHVVEITEQHNEMRACAVLKPLHCEHECRCNIEGYTRTATASSCASRLTGPARHTCSSALRIFWRLLNTLPRAVAGMSGAGFVETARADAARGCTHKMRENIWAHHLVVPSLAVAAWQPLVRPVAES